jgi:MFS family permease
VVSHCYTINVYRYTKSGRVPRERAQHEPAVRDGPTRLCYGTISAYAFWIYAFGPALALLRTELHFSYTMLGVYSALWAGGAAVAGLVFAPVSRRLPRASLVWFSALGGVAGVGLFVATRSTAWTLLGAFIGGLAGTILLSVSQAILSDQHGSRRDRALVEANAGAAACAVLTPVILGGLQATVVGWRAAMALPALALAWLYLRYRRVPLPARAAVHDTSGSRLPAACWYLAALVAVGIAVEFCVIYFGAELLATTGLSATAAATAMSAFYLGILLGRIGAALLTRSAGRAVLLVWLSLGVTAAGFLLFWLAGVPVPAVTGLFICGLGVANLYPLSLALALAAAPGRGDTVNARVQLLGGAFVVTAPYLLGSLADHLGLTTAFTVEPALIVASALLLLTGLRAGQPRPGLSPPAAVNSPAALPRYRGLPGVRSDDGHADQGYPR